MKGNEKEKKDESDGSSFPSFSTYKMELKKGEENEHAKSKNKRGREISQVGFFFVFKLFARPLHKN